MRIFLSINLPEEIKREVAKVKKLVQSEMGEKNSDKVKWENEDKYHITLFFLGDVEPKKIKLISDELSAIPKYHNRNSMSFKCGLFDSFPNLKFPRVLILNLENEDKIVYKLYEDICAVLKNYGFEPDKKFHLHITLGRVKKDNKMNLSFLKNKINSDIAFSSDRFFLMQSILDSRGSVYKTIQEFRVF